MRDEAREIQSETTVAVLLEHWPGLGEVFRQHGMSCPGCTMSRFDGLAYVARVYGIAPQRWLSELRSAARNPPRRRTSTLRASRPRGRRVEP